MSGRRFLPLLAAASLAVLAASCGGAEEPIRVAVLVDCEGRGAGFHQESQAGAALPLLRRGGKLAGASPSDGVDGVTIGGRPVELLFGCASEITSAAVELRRLVESEGADIVVGPNVAPLGVVPVEYAKHVPDVTFVVTSWEALTALRPGQNVFRFTGGYVQAEAGLGAYAYHRLGWRRAVTVASADVLGWGWSAGVIAEFCSLGGEIPDRVWLDVTPDKLRERLDEVPTAGIDGYFLMTMGPEAGAFLEHLAKTERYPGRKVVSSAAAATGLEPRVAARLGKRLVGIVFAWDSPGPGSAAYMKEFDKAFPRLAKAAGKNFHLFDIYLNNGMEAVLRGLEAVDGDLSDGQRRFRAALARVKLDAPNGHIRLDANRQAIGPTYMWQIDGYRRGKPHYHGPESVENVDASFGGHFGPGDPLPDRTQPPCEHGNPPAWARR